jgi:hypothetical protein
MDIIQRIARPAAEVYAFAADPAHLPLWAAGLSGSVALVEGQWVSSSPMGEVTVRFAPPNDDGVLDHTVVLPGGESVDTKLRVLPAGASCAVVFTLMRRPGMSQQELDDDAAAVRADLARLKTVVEARAETGGR